MKRRTYSAPTGANVTMCFSNASGEAKLTSAEFEVGKPLPIDHDSCVTFKVTSGTQSLFTTVVSPDPNDTYQVSEDCGGPTQKLEDEDIDPNDPARIYRIVGV
jgi:hypothetical protein